MRIKNFLTSIFLPILSLGRAGAGGTNLKSLLPIPLTNWAIPFAIGYASFGCGWLRCDFCVFPG